MKTAFNKEFEIVAQQKEQEIARIKERNLRIREILAQLDLQVEVWEPGLTCDENPEQVLTVQDSEVSEKQNFHIHPHKYSSRILFISSHCLYWKALKQIVSVHLTSPLWLFFFPSFPFPSLS